MSEKRRFRGSSVMGNKNLGVGSTTGNEPGSKKKSLSRIASSSSQADGEKGTVKKNKKKKGELTLEEIDDLDFPRDKDGKKKNVIWDKNMTSLSAVKTLHKFQAEMHRVQIPKRLKKITMTVEKKNPNFRKIQKVCVAVPAPKDIEARPLLPPVRRSPKLDEYGQVVPYTILGSVDDYVSEACRRGIHFQAPGRPPREMTKITFSKPKRIQPRHIPNVDEARALQYWKDIIADRERQKSNIIARTRREASEVIMGEARTFSKYRIIRGETTLPGVLENHFTRPRRKSTRETGFWTQPTLFGEDVTGFYGSLTKTKKGHPKGVEYVGVPDDICKEKGYIPLRKLAQSEDPDFDDVPRLHGMCATGHPIRHRHNVPVINIEKWDTNLQEQTSHTEAAGMNRTPASYPRILFGGHPAQWCDDDTLGVSVKAEVGMSGIAGQRMDNSLKLTNTGTTTIIYDWKKLPQKDTFELHKDRIQRFFFDYSYGIILPGQTKYIRAIFRSPNPGIFNEMWQFESRPLLEDGRAIILTLWGIARAVDVNQEARLQLERTLRHRGVMSICTDILDEVLKCLDMSETVMKPRRKSYQWIFENAPRVDDHFKAINKGFYYHSNVVKSLLELTPVSQVGSESDASSDLESVQILSLDSLKKTLECLPEDDENKFKLLWKFHRSVGSLCFPVQRPISAERFSIGRVLMGLFIDNMVTTSQRLRTMLGIYSESSIPGGMMSRIKNISKDIKGRRKTQPQVQPEAAAAAATGKNAPASGRKKSTKAIPDSVAQKLQEKTTKSRPDPLRYRKYKEKLYCQTYSLLSDMVEKLFSHLTDLTTSTTTIVKL